MPLVLLRAANGLDFTVNITSLGANSPASALTAIASRSNGVGIAGAGPAPVSVRFFLVSHDLFNLQNHSAARSQEVLQR